MRERSIIYNSRNYSILLNKRNGENYIKWAGIEHGVSDINFDGSKIGDDVVVKASYKVRFNFPFIGKQYLYMHQEAKVKCFK